ncbi:hypothetical protein Back11_05010 [Paenibacillus baekrokdamisoli]|uniref:Uncharacterized protein n=1 Tax=Paenibacillus baekrokdamisoli TaxID=1712516 RepID=A0A3G9ILE4_9BACL|nr:zinc-binding alcohol dehydrogenase [Paenibacillus baekrokdamisoli]MBB3067658.1 2-desacetyl-2-hydroxyethyl bacteriochlorophyllide A dehydrogenase [Paenibacillus baekrokdamisoli]BBH19156.1 hypothetical protein Back11_05010 [Paenibacillus baekrokdamisoli]
MSNPTIFFPQTKQVEIENRPMPSPANDELLIETLYTLISTGTELTILNGGFKEGSGWDLYGKFPFSPGYNNIGKVIDVGEDVPRDWIGKKVASYGSHAKYVVSSIQHTRLIHRDIPDEHAAFFTLAEIAMNGIRRSHITWGESAVVYGLGLIGQLAVRFAKNCGAQPVFAVDISDERLRKLPRDPAIIPINSIKENVVEIVKQATRGRMADVVFEVTGSGPLIPEEFKTLKKQGRFVLLSSPHSATPNFDFHDLCNGPSITIIGAHNSSHPQHETDDNPWTKSRHAELFFDLVGDKMLDVEPLISHRDIYTNAASLYQMLLTDRSAAMGVVLKWF